MPFIQKFQRNLGQWPKGLPEIEEEEDYLMCLYYAVDFKFRNTLTYLELPTFSYTCNNTAEQYRGLYKFISLFPNLKSLRCKVVDDYLEEHPVDIIKLVKSNKRLEELKVFGLFRIITETKIEEMSPATPVATLKDLHLEFKKIDLTMIVSMMIMIMIMTLVHSGMIMIVTGVVYGIA